MERYIRVLMFVSNKAFIATRLNVAQLEMCENDLRVFRDTLNISAKNSNLIN